MCLRLSLLPVSNSPLASAKCGRQGLLDGQHQGESHRFLQEEAWREGELESNFTSSDGGMASLRAVCVCVDWLWWLIWKCVKVRFY